MVTLLLPFIIGLNCRAQDVPTGGAFTNKLLTAESEDPTKAVSEINGKLTYAGGLMDGFAGQNFDGSVTIPIMHQFGFQADGLYSRISNLSFDGGAGHLFWRDPQIGLLGITGGYLYREGVDTYQVGVEGEYYWRRFTFSAFGGVGSIKYAQPVPFISTDPTRAIVRVSAGFYPVDNLLTKVSYTREFNNNLLEGNLEFQTPIRGLALTGEAAIGSHHYDQMLFGITYYFGRNKSLIDRHRQDDPPSMMQQILYGLGLYGADYTDKENQYIAANPGSGGGGDYGDYGDVTISTGNNIVAGNGGDGGISITPILPP
ncbi:MAG TPA: hypothetical protein VGN23_02040 [Verrucomicrobiae bacterium]